MNTKLLNGNGTIRVSTVVDWVFRILSFTLPFVIGLMLNIEHRVTVVENTRFTSTQGNELKSKIVRLEERCRGYEKELIGLEKQIDRLAGRK
jgi:hypothetical protein